MKTYFSNLHPVVIFVYYTIIAAMSMILKDPVALLFIAIGLFSYIYLFGEGIALKKFLFLFLTFTAIVLINMITNPRGRHILFYLLDRPITLEGAIWGVMTALAILNLLLVFVAGKVNFNSFDFLYIFSPIMPKISLLISMSFLFCEKFTKTIGKLHMVLKPKGISAEDGGLKKRLSDAVTILGTLITFSMEESLTTADSMRARGYGLCKRTSYRYHSIKKKDKVYMILIAIVTIFMIRQHWIVIGYMLIPYIEEGRFALKWKFLKQKI